MYFLLMENKYETVSCYYWRSAAYNRLFNFCTSISRRFIQTFSWTFLPLHILPLALYTQDKNLLAVLVRHQVSTLTLSNYQVLGCATINWRRLLKYLSASRCDFDVNRSIHSGVSRTDDPASTVTSSFSTSALQPPIRATGFLFYVDHAKPYEDWMKGSESEKLCETCSKR